MCIKFHFWKIASIMHSYRISHHYKLATKFHKLSYGLWAIHNGVINPTDKIPSLSLKTSSVDHIMAEDGCLPERQVTRSWGSMVAVTCACWPVVVTPDYVAVSSCGSFWNTQSPIQTLIICIHVINQLVCRIFITYLVYLSSISAFDPPIILFTWFM